MFNTRIRGCRDPKIVPIAPPADQGGVDDQRHGDKVDVLRLESSFRCLQPSGSVQPNLEVQVVIIM